MLPKHWPGQSSPSKPLRQHTALHGWLAPEAISVELAALYSAQRLMQLSEEKGRRLVSRHDRKKKDSSPRTLGGRGLEGLGGLLVMEGQQPTSSGPPSASSPRSPRRPRWSCCSTCGRRTRPRRTSPSTECSWTTGNRGTASTSGPGPRWSSPTRPVAPRLSS